MAHWDLVCVGASDKHTPASVSGFANSIRLKLDDARVCLPSLAHLVIVVWRGVTGRTRGEIWLRATVLELGVAVVNAWLGAMDGGDMDVVTNRSTT